MGCNCENENIKKISAVVKGFTRLSTDKLGITTTSPKAAQRLQICSICPHMNGLSCIKCGCLISAKIRQDIEICPIGKW